MMARTLAVLLVLLLDSSAGPVPADVRVGVFGLFHSEELTVSAADGVVSLRGNREGCVLRGGDEAHMRLDGDSIQVRCPGSAFTAGAIDATGSTGRSTDLDLSVPGRITRRFHGRLHVAPARHELIPVVSMDLETAVASVVAAEQIMSAPAEALKAQAVAARSFFVAARGRHRGFEFCDTTHCQFLRAPPAPDHPAIRAARDTTGLVIAFRGRPVPAFYSATCGGRTRTLADAGLQPAGGYPYFSVACLYCARRHGHPMAGGHGIGLCQNGAGAMAGAHGASFSEILRHYYPETSLEMLPH